MAKLVLAAAEPAPKATYGSRRPTACALQQPQPRGSRSAALEPVRGPATVPVRWLRLLITQALELRSGLPRYNFLGGKRDSEGETPWAVAAREAHEETGGLLSASARRATAVRIRRCTFASAGRARGRSAGNRQQPAKAEEAASGGLHRIGWPAPRPHQSPFTPSR